MLVLLHLVFINLGEGAATRIHAAVHLPLQFLCRIGVLNLRQRRHPNTIILISARNKWGCVRRQAAPFQAKRIILSSAHPRVNPTCHCSTCPPLWSIGQENGCCKGLTTMILVCANKIWAKRTECQRIDLQDCFVTWMRSPKSSSQDASRRDKAFRVIGIIIHQITPLHTTYNKTSSEHHHVVCVYRCCQENTVRCVWWFPEEFECHRTWCGVEQGCFGASQQS